MVHQSADQADPSLLWIDDEISPRSPDVRLLELEGFRVHCAVSGTAGLAMARTANYQGILLDLRLPDIPGLAVLTTLRADAITTPILVLTGFGDTDCAFAASQLGADGFKCKPLFGDDLSLAVQRLVGRASPVAGEGMEDPQAPRVRSQYASITTLLEALHGLSRSRPGASASNEDNIRTGVIAALVRALTNSALPMPVFLACAAALRRVLDAPSVDSRLEVVAQVQESVLGTLSRPTASDSRVVAAINLLEAAAAQRKRLKSEDIAKAQAVDASHLSRLVKTETGFEFTSWRTALLLRPCLNVLVETDEHIKQIACRVLCFSDETQFTHEFGRMFGLSPTEFRRIWQIRRK